MNLKDVQDFVDNYLKYKEYKIVSDMKGLFKYDLNFLEGNLVVVEILHKGSVTDTYHILGFEYMRKFIRQININKILDEPIEKLELEYNIGDKILNLMEECVIISLYNSDIYSFRGGDNYNKYTDFYGYDYLIYNSNEENIKITNAMKDELKMKKETLDNDILYNIAERGQNNKWIDIMKKMKKEGK